MAALSLLSCACSLISLDGFSGGDALLDGNDAGSTAGDGSAPAPPDAAASAPDGGLSDAGVHADGGADAGSDAGASPLASVVLAANVGSPRATGAAQNGHVVYAGNSGRWVLFYEDQAAPMLLKTRTSSDFATWTEGPALTLPYAHLGEGRNLAVAYQDTAGNDVFHLSMSFRLGVADRHHHHGRAVMQGGSLTFDSLVELGQVTYNGNVLDPDGTSVVALADGRILDGSGFYENAAGDVDVRVSTTADTGGAWSATFEATQDIASVVNAVNARQQLATFAGAISFAENGAAEPNPTDIVANRFSGTGWGGGTSVGFTATSFDANDWSAARLSDVDVHVVRWAGGYEHRLWNGTSWSDGGAIPSAPHAAGSGVVLLARAGQLLLFALDGGTGTLRSTSWSNGAWSSWQDVLTSTFPRSQLTGYAGPGGIALAWMEAKSGQLDIVGVRLP